MAVWVPGASYELLARNVQTTLVLGSSLCEYFSFPRIGVPYRPPASFRVIVSLLLVCVCLSKEGWSAVQYRHGGGTIRPLKGGKSKEKEKTTSKVNFNLNVHPAGSAQHHELHPSWTGDCVALSHQRVRCPAVTSQRRASRSWIPNPAEGGKANI
ncbi:hypothetical protein HL42_7688 [Trichophyton rubrum]|nr:hypothetical protein HL42_7688 [Trichophyton rubrum]